MNDNVDTSAAIFKIERGMVREMFDRKSDPEANKTNDLIENMTQHSRIKVIPKIRRIIGRTRFSVLLYYALC